MKEVVFGEIASLHMRATRFQLTITPVDSLSLPAYKGSTFRGGFGHTLRRILCAVRRETCSDCLLREKCVYSYIFETPPPAGTKIMRKYRTAPHPFVIEPPEEDNRLYSPGEELSFGLVLVGRMTFEGPLAPFMPLLRAGEILHVGKGTSFGLGRYEVK